MMARRWAALVLCGIVAGCTRPAAVEGPVRLGQLAYVGGPRVLPERVIEDSRCPVGTTCVWSGRVVLRTTVYGGSQDECWPKPVDLVLGVPVAIADGRLTLVAVTPARSAGQSARTATGSRFTFAFQGGL